MLLRDENQTLLRGKENLPVASQPFFCDPTIPVIMLTQMSFFVFAWTFAGLMMHKAIPLSDSRATWIQQNSSDTQVIVTLVSTVFALIGSSLLGKVVQFALVRRLSYAPLRLYAMVEWAKLAQRSISLGFDRHDRHVSWTLLSIAWVGLLGFLTTAWSTLLAPESVVIYYDFQGLETNFLNPALPNILNHNLPPPPSGFNLTTLGTDLYSGIFSDIDLTGDLMDAGFSAASAKARLALDHPVFNFVSIFATSYLTNISTGGIYPAGVPGALPNESFIPIGNPLYQGLSRTIDATQQGFTANVSCRMPQSNDPVITPNLMNSVQVDVNSDFSWTTDTYSWSVNCSSEAEYSTLGVVAIRGNTGENGLLLTSVCFGQGFNGPSNQSFLVLLRPASGSIYSSLSQTCQVSPLVTTVQATYDQTAIINIADPPLYQHPLPASTDQTRELLWFPAFTIWYAFVSSQGLSKNGMGDALLSFVELDASFPIEDYLRGMVEYIGSFMANSAMLHVRETEERTFINGTVTVQTIGWTFHLRTHGPSLAAITLVTALTVAAGIFAMMPINHYNGAGQTGRLQEASPGWFNPTGTIDVLLASSAGDLARVLSGSDGDYDHSNDTGGNDGAHDRHGVDERLGIMLEKTDKGWPALRTVHMDVTGAPADLERRGSRSCPNQVVRVSDDDPSNIDVAHRDILDKELREVQVG
ncbi:hypothetical protein L210DRAFT_983668 [Boletus edulis BED1]|uniref:Uncharacterized protein n=1 Tax=Boletus edulis BED1 TaxID=1328754 RepID=A0AAD4BBA9_BOLED|nr:hypothetical protein L210DRAFT_983668 [Boletus edulis BED1]